MVKFYLKLYLLLGLVLALSNVTFAQGSSNKGTDFWLGYGKHVSTGSMVLYITSDVNTTSTVTIPGIGFSQTVNIVANTVSFVDIPTTAHLNNDGLSANGIHVTSLKPVIVYAHIYQTSVSGATLVLPVNTLGKDYYSINYKQESNQTNSMSWFFVVAVEDNTQVEIIPSATTQGGWAANSVNIVNLKKGEIYNVLGTFTNTGSLSNGVDLTGSRIRSISTSGTCKKIAVFSGSSKIAINCLAFNYNGTTNPGSADNLFQQVYPTATWGKTFITVPHKDRNFVIYRIVKSDPTAVVTLNGAVIPNTSFVNNFYHEFASQKVDEVSSDKPIQLVQYAVTQNKSINCTNSAGDVGDPEMIFLNPLEQTLTQITMYSTPRFAITKHFINVVIKNTGVAAFKLDGVIVSNQFLPVPNNSLYSYAQLAVSAGTHNLSSNEGFNAIAYGFGNADSYGYAAGANLTAFGIDPVNSSTNQPVETGCVNNTYNFSVKLPYQAVDLSLDKGDGAGFKSFPINLESQTTINGITTYRYAILNNAVFSTAGTYSYKIKSVKPTIDDCGTTDEFNYDFIINSLPTAQFDVPVNNCAKIPIQFAYKVNANQTINQYLWDFNGEGTSTLEKPLFSFNNGGTKKVKLSVKSAEGCWSTVLEQDIVVNELPVVAFSNSSPVCEKNSIIFNDQSSSANGAITKWAWNFGDGASGVNNISTLQNPTHTFNTAGTYAIKLIITTENGCIDSLLKNVVVNPLPVVNFTNTAVCFAAGSTTFTNTTSIISNESLTFLWDFDDPNSVANNSSTLESPNHIYTAAGTYNVKLTATSLSGCIFSTIKQVIVYPKPVASFNAPAKSCFNDDVSFTNTSLNTGIIITDYLWDFNNGESTSTQQNPDYKFKSAGIKQVKFSVKTENGCWSDVFVNTLEVMQLPVANFTVANLRCEGLEFQFNDFSTTVGQTITEWSWDFGDVSSTNNSSTLQNPKHLYAKAGTYNAKLTVKTNLGCVGFMIKQVVVNPIPITNFETPDICLDDASALFTNTTTIADNTTLTYLWNFGDPSSGSNNTSTLRNPSHRYLLAKAYDVSLTVTSIYGCVITINKVFTVNGSTPKSDFLVQNSTLLCSDNDVKFLDKAIVDFGEITKIEWTFDTSNPTVIVTDNNPASRASISKTYSHSYPVFYSPAQKIINVKMKAYSGITCAAEVTKSITLRAIPKADFTLPDGCLPNGEATFTNLSNFVNSETGLVYSWDFGDSENNTSNLKNPTHQFKSAKTYIITLKITAPNGCETTIQKPFIVKGAIVNTDFLVQNNNSLCVNAKVVFTDNAKLAFGEISKLEWFFDVDNQLNNNAFKLIDTSPALRNATARTYEFSYPVFNLPVNKTINVKLIATTGDNCVSETTKTIILNAIPVADFTLPDGCLPNGEAIFTSLSTFNNTESGLVYSWDFGDTENNVSNLKNPSHTFKKAQTYLITLKVTAPNGCETIIQKPFVVKGAIVNSDFIIQNSNSLCANNKVVFTDDAKLAFGEISKLEWFFDFDNQPNNNAFRLIDTSPALRGDSPRTYEFSYPVFNSPLTKTVNVKLKAISGDNCESEIIKTITLKAVPNVVFSSIPSICAEVDNYQIIEGKETSGFIGVGEFSGKGVSKSGLFTPIVAGIGTHTLTYTFIGQNGCIDSKTSSITVFETPTAFASEDKTILIGGNIILDAKASGKNVSYKWTPSTGLDRDDILQPTATPIKDIIYTLIVKSEDGCTITDEVFVKVLEYPVIPNTFTPNGDGVNDNWDIKYLESYPDITISVFDRNGNVVFKSNKYTKGWDGKNNNVDLPVGVYYYIVTAKSGTLKYNGSVVIIR